MTTYYGQRAARLHAEKVMRKSFLLVGVVIGLIFVAVMAYFLFNTFDRWIAKNYDLPTCQHWDDCPAVQAYISKGE